MLSQRADQLGKSKDHRASLSKKCAEDSAHYRNLFLLNRDLFRVGDRSKTTSPSAGGELGFRQGATKEQSQSSVTEEQRSRKPNSPQPEGAGRRHATCDVTRRLNPHEGIRPPRALHPTRRRSRQKVNLFLIGP